MRRCLVVLLWLLPGLMAAWASNDTATAPTTKPVAGPPDEARIRGLIEDLADGHDNNGKGRKAYGELRGMGEQVIPYLDQALGDRRKNVRWLATEVLGAMNGPTILPPLMKAAKDTDRDVRYYAVCFLGQHGKGNADVLAALQQALEDSDARVAYHAVLALSSLGDKGFTKDDKLLARLIKALDNAEGDDLSYTAQALGLVGNAKACEPLVNAMGRSPQAVSDALARIGSKDACKTLLKAMQDNPDKAFIPAMGRTLSQLADPSLNDELLVLTKSASQFARQGAAEALGFAGNIKVVTRLSEMLADRNEHAMTRNAAAAALGGIGGDDAAAVLARVFAGEAKEKIDAPEGVRRTVAGALGTTRSPKALAPLLAALGDDQPYVVMHAAEALGRLGDAKAVPALLALLDRPDALETRASAPHFANIATVVDLALRRIDNPKVQPRAEYISKPVQLQQIRAKWASRFDSATMPASAPLSRPGNAGKP